MRALSWKSPQIYLSILEANTKAKVSKVYTVTHAIHIYTISNFTNLDFSIRTYKHQKEKQRYKHDLVLQICNHISFFSSRSEDTSYFL